MGTLDNKTIVITGATGLVGKNSAHYLAQQGATIILIGRKKNALNDLYDEIINAGGKDPAIIHMDLAKTTVDDFYGLAETLESEFGAIDGIIHAAANLANLTPLAHTTPEKWALSLNITLNAPFYLTQALLPLLLKSPQSASVIFFEHREVAGNGKAYWGGYAVAKAGIATLMKLFANEFESQKKIQFNSIDPVCLNSTLRYSVNPAGARETKDIEELMNLIVYLNEDRDEFITGQSYQL